MHRGAGETPADPVYDGSQCNYLEVPPYGDGISTLSGQARLPGTKYAMWAKATGNGTCTVPEAGVVSEENPDYGTGHAGCEGTGDD